MVNVGLLGAFGVEKENILRLFIHYVDAGLITQIDPDINCTIIKAQIAGKIIIDSPKRVRKGKKKRTAKDPAGLVLHPADRIVFREDNNGNNHTLFAPGGDRERAVVKMGIITICRIARKIIAVFDVTRELDSQFKFFTDVRFFPKDIAVCLIEYDLLVNKNEDQADATVKDYQAKISEFFEKRRIMVTGFYPSCAETKDEYKKFNDAVVNMLLDITVRSPDVPVSEATPTESKTNEMSKDAQIQDVKNTLTTAREGLYQAYSYLRADFDAALDQLESSYKLFCLAESHALQFHLSDLEHEINNEKSQVQGLRAEFEKKGAIYKIVLGAKQLLGQATDEINDDPLKAVGTANNGIQQFSNAEKMTPPTFVDLLVEIKDEKENAVRTRDEFQRIFDHHSGIKSNQPGFAKMESQFYEWISRKDAQFDEWISQKIQSSLKSADQRNRDYTDLQARPSLTEDQIRLGALLDKIEHYLRDILEIILTRSFGEDWIEDCFKSEERRDIRSRWKKRHEDNSTHRLIDELTFSQYKQLLTGKKRKLIFERDLIDYNFIIGSFDTVTDIRNNAVHKNWHLIEWRRDLALLEAFYATLVKAMEKIKQK